MCKKVGVRISKQTGGAYADVREVIESELGRIKQKQTVQFTQSDLDAAVREERKVIKTFIWERYPNAPNMHEILTFIENREATTIRTEGETNG